MSKVKQTFHIIVALIIQHITVNIIFCLLYFYNIIISFSGAQILHEQCNNKKF